MVKTISSVLCETTILMWEGRGEEGKGVKTRRGNMIELSDKMLEMLERLGKTHCNCYLVQTFINIRDATEMSECI